MPKAIRILGPLCFIILSACSFSLAEDLVPPPGSKQQVVIEPSIEPISGPLYPIVAPDPLSGAGVYADKCQPCHGDKGLGDGPMASRSAVPIAAIGTDEVARPSIPAEWYALLTQGDMERGMPPFRSLSDRQKWDVIAYVYQLSTPPDELTQSEVLYTENCLGCHGETGQGDGADAVGLAVTPRDLTDQKMMAELSAANLFETISNGDGDSMPSFADTLTENEIWALTDYLRNLTFRKADTGSTDVQASNAYPAPESVNSAYPGPEENSLAYPEPEIITTTETMGLGVVRVELISPDGAPITMDVPVTLYGFDDMQNTYSQTLTTGEQGIYTFTDVEFPADRAFIAGAEYNGGSYGSDLEVAQEGIDEIALQIQVYDTSTDTSSLIIDRAHIFLNFVQEGLVQVVEVFVISNPSDTAIVSAEEGGAVANFLLPEGATDLQFQDGLIGERYLEIPGGFADTATVQPGSGEYQVVFAYNLPYDGKLEFDQPMTMDANAVVVMVPDTGIKVKGEKITDDGTRDMQNTKYHIYSSDSLQSGDALQFSVSGKLNSGNQAITTNSTQTIAIGLGVFGLALIGAGVWYFFRNRDQGIADTDGDIEEFANPASAMALQDSDSLMDAIIALDDLYQEGKLPEEAYLRRRDELKSQLKQVMDSQR